MFHILAKLHSHLHCFLIFSPKVFFASKRRPLYVIRPNFWKSLAIRPKVSNANDDFECQQSTLWLYFLGPIVRDMLNLRSYYLPIITYNCLKWQRHTVLQVGIWPYHSNLTLYLMYIETNSYLEHWTMQCMDILESKSY